MQPFQIVSEFQPAGDQPDAIAKLISGFAAGKSKQCLLGVTGSGKTFTMAHTIAAVRRPTLVISHNKTLAAQLYEEFRGLFPHNAVEYFVSYYDYYQPEAYIPQRDIYIEKDASRNDDLDRLRLAATSSLVSREDVVIVSSVSCLYGLGSPDEYKRSVIPLEVGMTIDRDELLEKLIDLQYHRKDMGLERGAFRVRGDVIELHTAYEQVALRIEMFGDEIDRLERINPVSGQSIATLEREFIYPAVHYVMPKERLQEATQSILDELDQRVMEFRRLGKLLEAQRLLARTKYDVEMMREVGYCSGIENYTRHLHGTPPGAKPFTLFDYYPEDFLLIIDESHQTIPQIGAMFNGDRARKQTLVDHGFRLPSALDNRPLRFEEFEQLLTRAMFVSATPGPYELRACGGEIVEQIIRPTGLIDPPIEVHPATGQVPDLLHRIRERAAIGERVLVTTLTKRLAEDLADYIEREGMRGRYMHSDIDTLERVTILRELREGIFDVLVGVNLLREGLDLPEVSLVAILDADKEGFLRSETSLIQMIGRTARNINALVVLYADKITPSMQRAMEETDRRRSIQIAWNEQHGITPVTIKKAIRRGLEDVVSSNKVSQEVLELTMQDVDRDELIEQVEKDMLEAAQNLEFEKAARLRDQLQALRNGEDILTAMQSSATSSVAKGKRGKGSSRPGAGRARPRGR